MPTFKPCDSSVSDMAKAVLNRYPTHTPLVEAKLKIDLLFAYPEYDENGEPVGCALKHHGVPAHGICRKLSLKDRSKGHGDAEICLDGDWWGKAAREEQEALLDHELHHLTVMFTKNGVLKTDDLGRPLVKLRKHDFEFGWFTTIARRHGVHSQERQQAALIMQSAGQYYWPEITGTDKSETLARAIRTK
jgi:hypothetical protein